MCCAFFTVDLLTHYQLREVNAIVVGQLSNFVTRAPQLHLAGVTTRTTTPLWSTNQCSGRFLNYTDVCIFWNVNLLDKSVPTNDKTAHKLGTKFPQTTNNNNIPYHTVGWYYLWRRIVRIAYRDQIIREAGLKSKCLSKKNVPDKIRIWFQHGWSESALWVCLF